MPSEKPFPDAAAFAAELSRLRRLREAGKLQGKLSRPKRRGQSRSARQEILRKTDGRCHICGGEIGERERWNADHVLAHSAGGGNDAANYLPAHSTCNNYRWDYASQEFQWILKLGVWLRTEVERGTPLGKFAAEQFMQYEKRRLARRSPTADA